MNKYQDKKVYLPLYTKEYVKKLDRPLNQSECHEGTEGRAVQWLSILVEQMRGDLNLSSMKLWWSLFYIQNRLLEVWGLDKGEYLEKDQSEYIEEIYNLIDKREDLPYQSLITRQLEYDISQIPKTEDQKQKKKNPVLEVVEKEEPKVVKRIRMTREEFLNKNK